MGTSAHRHLGIFSHFRKQRCALENLDTTSALTSAHRHFDSDGFFVIGALTKKKGTNFHLRLGGGMTRADFGHLCEQLALQPDFVEAQAALERCSASARYAVTRLLAEFEWKGGWLTSRLSGKTAMRKYQKALAKMPEAPALVEDLAWRFIHTAYWQAYYRVYERVIPTRDTFHQRFFVAILSPMLPAAPRHTQQSKSRSRSQPLRAPRLPRLSLRFRILQRDGFRCRLCGLARDDSPDVRLEVDHIVPRSRGGSNDPDNLWVLCFSCNRGKHARVL
jgi:5-methylcytosine-specific restriction endonuclease McrA